MRILVVTTQDRFFLSHIRERACYFKKKGCVVGVAAQKTSDALVKEIRDLGFIFFDTEIERQSIDPFSQLVALVRLYRIQSVFKPDISYHLGAKSIFYGTFMARLYNSRVGIVNAPIGLGYVFASNSLKAKILRPLVLQLYRFFLNPSKSKVIVENFEDINYFIRKGFLNPRDAFCILGAGVDTDYFSPLPFSERNKVCTVVMASRLIREKGVFDFVEVASRLYEKKIPVRMQLIGSPDYGNPSSLTQEDFEVIKQNPAVECLGFQQNVASFLQKAHICCLPSFYREGLPKILLEAASCGLAILTTDTIGCKEAVREKNGLLFTPHDTKELADLIDFLVKHPEELKQMTQASRRVSISYFDTNKISARTYEVIRSVLSS